MLYFLQYVLLASLSNIRGPYEHGLFLGPQSYCFDVSVFMVVLCCWWEENIEVTVSGLICGYRFSSCSFVRWDAPVFGEYMVRLVLAACWVVPLIGIKWPYRFWLVIVLLVYVQLYTVSYTTIWHYYYVSYYSMPLACYQALGASTFCLILTVLLWTWMSIFLLSVLLIIHSQWNYWIICWFGFFFYINH